MSDTSAQNGSEQPAPGRLASLVHEAPPPDLAGSFPARTCVKIAVLAAVFVWLNFWQFRILTTKWINDGNWSHGFLIPLFSLYFLYSRRDELLSAPRKVNILGLPILLLGIVQTLVGVYPIQNNWTSHVGMIVTIFGMVLYLGGWRIIRVTWLPIVFLIFAMPIPETLYGQIALPLQNLAASASYVILKACGVVIPGGPKASTLTLISVSGTPQPLVVAEACSGMRMLMAFLALGVAMAYLDDRPVWQRITLVVMGVPIAVVCNILRVVITSTMFVWDRPELGRDFMHSFTGMLMLIPALLMLLGLSRLLQALYVEEDEEPDDEADGESDEPSPATPKAMEGPPTIERAGA